MSFVSNKKTKAGEAEMKSENVTIFVFTGTGNTLQMARVLKEELEGRGKNAFIAPMERTTTLSLPEDSAVGLAVPVACFTTYPTAWRFIHSLPQGDGREIFFLSTMAGAGGGMEIPIRHTVEKKGYLPIGSKLVKMPTNYANRILPLEQNRKTIDSAKKDVVSYAKELTEGRSAWRSGNPILAAFSTHMVHSKFMWRLFSRMFPLVIREELCSGCGLCVRLCPKKNISMPKKKAIMGKACEFCQRCRGFCPTEAICFPGKPRERYRAVEPGEMMSFLRETE